MKQTIVRVIAMSLSVLFLFLTASISASRPYQSANDCCIYGLNADHPWNRLFSTLFIRQVKDKTYGANELDPLLWIGTDFLLVEPSHHRALLALDEFLKDQAQNQVHDPIKRAMMEHDLWAVFDWSALTNVNHSRQRNELQIRLAEILRRIAPTKDQIASLPDNYETAVESGDFASQYDPNHRDRAFLPVDLFRKDGDWISIGGGFGPVAKQHIAAFYGRSSFFEFIRLPKGRKATVDYLRTLWDYPQPWIADHHTAIFYPESLNPVMPQFPDGTELALVRKMNLFDHDGSLANAPLTESVQIRVFRSVPTEQGVNPSEARSGWEDVYEFKLDRSKLFAGQSGGLRAVARDEQEFPVFATHGIDMEEPTGILHRCVLCHSSNLGFGIFSVRSIVSLLKPTPFRLDSEPAVDIPQSEAIAATFWKQSHYSWGLLTGYWMRTSGQ